MWLSVASATDCSHLLNSRALLKLQGWGLVFIVAPAQKKKEKRWHQHRRRRQRGFELRVPAPPTKYKTPLCAKIHPKIHPESSPETKIQKKYEKITKTPNFCIYFPYFFCILVSGEDSGCILGCIFALRGVLYFVGGARTRKLRVWPEVTLEMILQAVKDYVTMWCPKRSHASMLSSRSYWAHRNDYNLNSWQIKTL